MKIYYLIIPVFLSIPLLFSCAPSGNRGFIGTHMKYYPKEEYKAPDSCTVVMYDNFNDNTLSRDWLHLGHIDFFEKNRSLKAEMRTRKRMSVSGAVVCKKTAAMDGGAVRLTVEYAIPNRGPTIATSLFLCPVSAKWDQDGHPDAYIRYFKRSQMEFIEAKKKDERPRLLWGQNQTVKSGEPRRCSLKVDSSAVSLTINGQAVFSAQHGCTGLDEVKAGMWVSTKGTSFGGGNVVFDNFVLETISRK